MKSIGQKTITGMSTPHSASRDGELVIAVTIRFDDDPQDEEMLVFDVDALQFWIQNMIKSGMIEPIPKNEEDNN